MREVVTDALKDTIWILLPGGTTSRLHLVNYRYGWKPITTLNDQRINVVGAENCFC